VQWVRRTRRAARQAQLLTAHRTTQRPGRHPRHRLSDHRGAFFQDWLAPAGMNGPAPPPRG